VEIAQILLENGARDEWGDLSGTYARDYIRDDEIGVLFKKHGFSLNYNYETKKYEPDIIRKEIQPTQRGKAISFSTNKKSTQTAATDEPQPGPSRNVLFNTSTGHQLCLQPTTTDEPQPGPSGIKRSRVSDKSKKDFPMLIRFNQTTTPKQLDATCYIIYDPTLRDDSKLPKNNHFWLRPGISLDRRLSYSTTKTHKLYPPRLRKLCTKNYIPYGQS
jgi:hypothetical protein